MKTREELIAALPQAHALAYTRQWDDLLQVVKNDPDALHHEWEGLSPLAMLCEMGLWGHLEELLRKISEFQFVRWKCDGKYLPSFAHHIEQEQADIAYFMETALRFEWEDWRKREVYGDGWGELTTPAVGTLNDAVPLIAEALERKVWTFHTSMTKYLPDPEAIIATLKYGSDEDIVLDVLNDKLRVNGERVKRSAPAAPARILFNSEHVSWDAFNMEPFFICMAEDTVYVVQEQTSLGVEDIYLAHLAYQAHGIESRYAW